MNDKTEQKPVAKEQPEQGSMPALSAQDILTQSVELETKWVEVPGWGGGVWIRELTGLERDRFEGSLVKGRGTKRRVDLVGSRARLVSMGCIQGPSFADVESGKAQPPDPRMARLLFTPRDVKKLSQLGAKSLEEVAEKIRILSGITDEDEDTAVDDLGNGQSAGSGSF